MKICNSCGCQMPDEAISCSACGAPLTVSQVPQQPYQQQDYQQAGYYQQPYAQPVYIDSNAKGMAVASLVLGGLSLVTGTVFVGLILGIIGCVLGVKARNKMPMGHPDRGVATAGMVCSIIGIVIGGIALVSCLCIVGIGGCATLMEDMMILGGVL